MKQDIKDTNLNPSVIARETLKQLAILKISPTPDNYHKLYDQIAGNPENQISAITAKLLSELAKEFPRHTPPLLNCANNLEEAVSEKNWPKYKAALIKFISNEIAAGEIPLVPVQVKTKSAIPWGETIGNLFAELDRNQTVSVVEKKRNSFRQVLHGFASDSELLHDQLSALLDSWKAPMSEPQEQIGDDRNEVSLPAAKPEYVHGSYAGQLLDLLAQMLENVIANQISNKILAEEARSLALQVREIKDKPEMEQFVVRFQQFCVRLELSKQGDASLQQGLLKLLNLLMDSTGELLSEDQWIKSQLAKLKETMARPLDMQIVARAEQYLAEIVQRQEVVKNSLSKARVTMRQMVTSLISNLEELSDATGDYQQKLEGYAKRINEADDIDEINQLLAEIMQETQKVQKNVLNYRNDLITARAEAETAQSQINLLETQLQEMGEKVHEDHLTGILNRRGFDNAYQREASFATRNRAPLCFALLDIDNFKQLNDTHGHHVGDNALRHLVDAVKETVRREDVVSRYGGEEFVILLPNTGLKEAIQAISRIRRFMTKKFFLYDNNRLLITFSAGVAQFNPGESQEDLFKRADEALYRAKKNGKNQVVAA
ncbi:MAG: diguanylate cyclase [Proteobacteria bacterium]|nr:diguanylate cyclase [Pseudomonadota bacterium]